MSKIVAHRGASALKTENTLEAFDLAIRLGADFVELDIWETLDGVLIVHHDRGRDGLIFSDMTYSEISNTKGFEYIPTLEQVLKLTAGRVKLYLEIKGVGYEKAVVDLALKYFTVNDFTIISFQDKSIRAVKDYHPDIYAGLLLVERINGKLKVGFNDLFPILRMRACKADFMAPRYIPQLTGAILLAYICNIPLYVWTINKPNHYKFIKKLRNVETIASDLPPEMHPVKLKKKSRLKNINLQAFNLIKIR